MVTVGLPVLNCARFVEVAIASIRAQTFTDWELVIIDDGSTDGSVEAIRRQIARHGGGSRITFLADGKHRGIASRLNQIASMAQGEYIARMDADDLMHPGRLEKQVACLRRHPDIDLLGTAIVIIGKESVPLGVRVFPAGHAEIFANPLRQAHIAHASVMGKREWFSANPYEDSSDGHEDWKLWLTAAGNLKAANLQEPLYFYRERDSYRAGAYAAARLRMVARILAEREQSFTRRASEALRAVAAAGAHLAASAIGASGAILDRRNQPLSAEEAEQFAEVLRILEAPAASVAERVALK